MKRSKIDKRASILIAGAGPAGLSAAYYLKKYGFKNVTVMERLGSVGGLCCSATFEIAGEPLKERIVFVLHPPPVGEPLILSQQYGDNEHTAFYAYLPTKNPTSGDEARLKKQVARYARAIGSRIDHADDWHQYDVWHYFRHIGPEDFRKG